MPRHVPLSIERAGGIVAFLNVPEQVILHGGRDGGDFEDIMKRPISDRTKSAVIKQEYGNGSYKTGRDWMRRYYDERAVK